MSTKGIVRSGKNLIKGYSAVQVKVRAATSNDPWGPSGTEMRDIAEMSHDQHDFAEIMDMLDRRLNDKGKNWRHVYKSLVVFDYVLHMGSENCVLWGKDNIYLIKTLREFVYVDEEGKDQGANIRVKAKDLTSLLQDDDRMRSERKNRSHMRNRIDENGDNTPMRPQKSGRTQSQRNRVPEDTDDPEMRRALEASKVQAEADARKRNATMPADDDDDLQRALKLSEEEEAGRKRRLEQQSQMSLFDDRNDYGASSSANAYQQNQQVDFFGNPILDNGLGQQNTGHLQSAYSQINTQNTGAYPQSTGYQPNRYQQYQEPYEDYGGGPHDFLTAQNTGYNSNPYAPQMQAQATGFNNPYATPVQKLEPVKTGSNNPFAQFGLPQQQPQKAPVTTTLHDLSQQRHQEPAFAEYQRTQSIKPQKTYDDGKHGDLAALIGRGNESGLDTYGNTGDVRVAAHHTASGGFLNSQGTGVRPQQTGNNPFLTGSATGPVGPYNRQNPGGSNQGYLGSQQSGGSPTAPMQQSYGQYQQQPQQVSTQGYNTTYNPYKNPNSGQQQGHNQSTSLIDL